MPKILVRVSRADGMQISDKEIGLSRVPVSGDFIYLELPSVGQATVKVDSVLLSGHPSIEYDALAHCSFVAAPNN